MYYFIKRYRAWFLLAFVSTTSVILWLATLSGRVGSMYQFFPILGVLAWTTMWVHYVAGSIGKSTNDKQFTKWTEAVVLLLIVAHPSIFLVQRFLDTGLLPPESYVSYVGPLRAWAVVIAIAALATFLLYDVLKRFRSKLIARGIWPYFSLLQASAMVAIFVHGFTLGTSMNSVYFVLWWIFLGVLLVPCLIIQVIRDFQASFSQRTNT
ncbi:hypothetical protein CL689_04800 [Candidatus Saccharibacteria bacterium]|mgnify:FL=1|nr:hypothetical protein [Candidatus Saccharibacteria bacterium]MBJ58507.1 hypothetical protein [Candidatus Saccharibacteria bacterium]MBQ69359.1 hypothetical protein [Candidatus Saccharibacteria bacterium]|tara:strand:- start:916 stop:1542 length:627 start_codon:yes stop_codon:yes gene_type:complete